MTTIGIIPGRFNPPTVGHQRLYQKSLTENDLSYVIIIQGKLTGLNKLRNPLSFKQKKKIIKYIEPKINVRQFPEIGSPRSPRADVPGIIVELLENIRTNEKDFQFIIYAGTDQIEMYTIQAENPVYIQKIKDELDRPDYNISIKVEGVGREESADDESGYSATKVREAIRVGNDALAMKMMGITDEDFYEEVKAAVLAGVKKEAVKQSINKILEKI
jgi:citrate lyase synthetase